MVAKTAGVISTPHRVSRSLRDGTSRVFVCASDGLWDFVPNEEVMAIATQAPDARTAAVRGCVCRLRAGCAVRDPSLCPAVQHTLVRTARTRWLERTACSDDTTIIVVTLPPLSG